jgi:hypothetical protein
LLGYLTCFFGVFISNHIYIWLLGAQFAQEQCGEENCAGELGLNSSMP